MEPQAESPQGTSAINPETNSAPPVISAPVPEPPKKKSKKFRLFLLVVLLILAAGAGGYIYATKKNKKPTAVTSTTTVIKTTTPTKAALAPYGLLYRDDTNITTATYLQPLDGSKPQTSTGLPVGSSIRDVYKNEVLAEAQPDKSGPQLWYSKDAGKSFTKVFTGAAPQNDTSYGDQITSTSFSTDGTSVLAAVLTITQSGTVTTSKNVIKQIDLANATTKDIYTQDASGVFIIRFDATANKIFYRVGCFDCDGGPTSIIYEYDIATATKSTFYTAPTGKNYTEMTFNNTATKIALNAPSETGCQGIGGCAPYTLEEYDVAAKTTRKIATVSGDIYPDIGYLEDNTLYYSSGTAITLVDSVGKETSMYQSADPILSVQFVSKKQIVARTGTYDASKVVNFDVASKKSTDVMIVPKATTISQVTWQ